MKIGLDLNGVIVNSHEAKRRALEEVTGCIIPAESFCGKLHVARETRFERKDGNGRRTIAASDYAEAMRLLHEDEHNYLSWSEPFHGVAEALQMLCELGCSIAVVTKVANLSDGIIRKWVGRHGLAVSEIIIAREQPKIRFYGECDLVIDNELQHLLEPAGSGIQCILMMPAPGMTGCRGFDIPTEIPPSIKVAEGWGDALEFIAGPAEQKVAA